LFHPHLNPGGSARVYKKGTGFFLQAVILNRVLVFAIGQVIGGKIALPAAVFGKLYLSAVGAYIWHFA